MARRTLALTAVTLASLAATAHAQKAITGFNTTIDFTGYTGAGLAPTPGAGQVDSDDFRVTGLSDGATAFGATKNTGDYARGASTGGETVGGLYAFTVAASDPAFGFQPAGSDMTPGDIDIRYVNSTGGTIVNPVVSFEVWMINNDNHGTVVQFSHSTNGTTFTSVGALDVSSALAADGTPAWAVTTRTTTLTGVSVADGANLFLRFHTDDTAGGADGRDEVAIDDIVISIPGCGDNIVQAGEQCDDPAPAENSDGCDATCHIETGYSCFGSPSVCAVGCGDGIVAGLEECDDSPPAENNDGCSAFCAEEPGYNCAGSPSLCTAVCGDGVVAGGETCDDDDVTPTDGDGCSALCVLEAGWTCPTADAACVPTCGDGLLRGGEACDDVTPAENGDGCSATCTEETGYDCAGEPSVCTATCGDGVIAVGAETCDDNDGTPMAGDGCSVTCAPEAGWTCAGTPSVCSSICQDGLVVGAEECDDDNSTAGDGCTMACTEEHGFTCSGSPSTCASECGDGLVAGNEDCDDAGDTAGDGCDEGCGAETGWICSNEPSVCVVDTDCGNGVLDGVEECDDGARADDDGCSSGCMVEFGFVCDGEPSDCQGDADGDGVPDGDDNCPSVANPQQPDEDDDGIGDICDDETGVPGGGCCAVGGGGSPAGWALLSMFVLVGLRRRRRA